MRFKFSNFAFEIPKIHVYITGPMFDSSIYMTFYISVYCREEYGLGILGEAF